MRRLFVLEGEAGRRLICESKILSTGFGSVCGEHERASCGCLVVS